MDNSASNKTLSPGPKTRVCYICGRQYGLHSYEIHLKQCKELWVAREGQKDPKERKPLPEDPALRMLRAGGGGEEEGSPTKGGGRSKAATAAAGDSQELSLDEINRLASETFNTESMSSCEFCGRTFLAEKLVIHNRSCTADHPARRVDASVRRGGELPKISTPLRPTTKSGVREDLVAVEEEPHLAGPMGGAAGRGVRKANAVARIAAPAKRSLDASAAAAAAISSKEEAIAYLSTKVADMESLSDELVRSIAEVKGIIASLASLP